MPPRCARREGWVLPSGEQYHKPVDDLCHDVGGDNGDDGDASDDDYDDDEDDGDAV